MIMNTVNGNTSEFSTIYVYGEGLLIDLSNVTIADNKAVNTVSIGGNYDVGYLYIWNSILYNPLTHKEIKIYSVFLAELVYSTVRNLYTLGSEGISMAGATSAPPQFVSAHTGKYQLKETSPCVDKGHPDSYYNDAYRPPAKGSARCDQGAYGGKDMTNEAEQTEDPYIPEEPDIPITDVINSNSNYVRTITPLIAVTSVPSYRPVSQYAVNTRYIDGLGRQVQIVDVGASPSKKDIVTPIGFDPLGRQSRQYLPYPVMVSNGLCKTGAIAAQNSFYASSGLSHVHDQTPWTEMFFEQSAFDRPEYQYAEGKAWRNSLKRQTFAYRANTSDEVL
jgi:hypothetical protein